MKGGALVYCAPVGAGAHGRITLLHNIAERGICAAFSTPEAGGMKRLLPRQRSASRKFGCHAKDAARMIPPF